MIEAVKLAMAITTDAYDEEIQCWIWVSLVSIIR